MRRLIAIIYLAFASDALAQDLVLNGEVMEEAEHDRTLISKPSWLRGLHIVGDTPTDREGPLILAVVPRNWTEFCGQVTSIGGDYSAIVQFSPSAPADVPRSARLGYDAKSDIARTSNHANGGVVLERGACTDDRMPSDGPREFTANFWNVANTPVVDANGFARVVLNMNVARADRIIPTAVVGGTATAVDCARLMSPEALAFNYQCTIPVPAADLADSAAVPVDFAFTRFYRGRVSKPLDARIYVGAVGDIDLGANR